MKKLFNLFALLALGTLSALAQWTYPVPQFEPMADDGETEQYLYNVDAGGFFIGANDWETRASISTTNGATVKMAKVYEDSLNWLGTWAIWNNGSRTGQYMKAFADSPQSIWVDTYDAANCNSWVVTALGDNKYEITNPDAGPGKLGMAKLWRGAENNRLWLLDPTNEDLYDDWGNYNAEGECTTWAFVSKKEYDALAERIAAYNEAKNLKALMDSPEAQKVDLTKYQAVYKNTNSTAAELAKAAESLRVEILDAQITVVAQNVDGLTMKTTGGNWAKEDYGEGRYVYEAYAGYGGLDMTDFSMTKKMTLPAGTYKLVVNAFYRYGESADTNPSVSCANLFAGNKSVRIQTLSNGGYSSASSMYHANDAFYYGYYTNELEFTLDKKQEIELGISGCHEEMGSWFCCGQMVLYVPKVVAVKGELEALMAEAKEFGLSVAAAQEVVDDDNCKVRDVRAAMADLQAEIDAVKIKNSTVYAASEHRDSLNWPYTENGITVMFGKGQNGDNHYPYYYDYYGYVYMYPGNELIVWCAKGRITKLNIECYGSYRDYTFTYQGYTVSSGTLTNNGRNVDTWTGNAKSVTLRANGYVYPVRITVEGYEASEPEEGSQRAINMAMLNAIEGANKTLALASEVDETGSSLISQTADKGKALIAAIAKAQSVGDATQEDINELNTAHEAFRVEIYQLSKPTIAHASTTAAIETVALNYSLPNTQLYYSVNGGEAVAYTAPFMADETCDIVAWGVSADNVRTQNSDTLHIGFDYLTVHVAEPGTLGRLVLSMLTDSQGLRDVTLLRITGSINSTDIADLQGSMTGLQGLDLSDLDMTDMPSSMLRDKAALSVVKLPKALKTIGDYAMYNCDALKQIVIPEGVTTIGYRAFYDSKNLLAVDMPESVASIGSYAFYNCYALTSIDIPAGVTRIENYTFYNCYALDNVRIPESVTSIGSNVFYNCDAMKAITIPASVTTIGSQAFCSCDNLVKVTLNEGLQTIGSDAFSYTPIAELEIPSTVTTIDSYAFQGCTKLTKLTLNEGLQNLNYCAFGNCDALESVELPSSLVYQEEAFYNCRNLRTVVCKAPCVPRGDYNLISGIDLSNATLYVPEMTIVDYKLSSVWNGFGSILPLEGYQPENYIVRRDMTIDANRKVTNKPNVSIEVFNNNETYAGNMWVYCDTLSMKKFSMRQDENYYYNRTLNGWSSTSYDPERCFTTLMSKGSYMRADEVEVSHYLRSNRWTFLCLPFNVKVSDIKHTNNNTQWVLRKYNGANRAAGTGSTWENVPADGILAAGEGFIIQHNEYDYGSEQFFFPAIDDTKKNDIFTNKDVTVELNEYTGDEVFAHNRSWNLVGNPYPTFYDLRYSDLMAPITVWKGNSYAAYSPLDDEYILYPFEAFFVQRPVDQAAIEFSKDGRQSNSAVRSDVSNAAPHKVKGNMAEREVFNLILSDGERSDRTRFVLNAAALCDYEMDCDAAKFFADGADAVELYTVENGVQLAINERPMANGIVKLGMRVARAGEYSIALNTRSAVELVLVDLQTGIETPLTDGAEYTFRAEAGNIANRFEVRIADAATAIAGTGAQDAKTEFYTTGGVLLNTKPAARGVYMMKQNGAVRKVVVK